MSSSKQLMRLLVINPRKLPLNDNSKEKPRINLTIERHLNSDSRLTHINLPRPSNRLHCPMETRRPRSREQLLRVTSRPVIATKSSRH